MYFSLALLVAATGALAQSDAAGDADLATKQQWCVQQKTSCPLLCLQFPGNSAATTSNDCDPETLAFSCVCVNGKSPNATEYSQTIPYFECTETNNQCVTNCGQNSACASACRADNPCGAKDPTRVNTSTISTTMSKTATDGSASATGSSSGSDSTSDGSDSGNTAFATLGNGPSQTSAAGGDGSDSNGNKSGASGLAVDVGRSCGLAIVLGGMFAGAMLVL